VENLNVCTRWGLRPYSRQIMDTVKFDTPTSAASSRVDQCVTPSRWGGPARVRATMSRRISSSISRGRPGRGRSLNASMPPSA